MTPVDQMGWSASSKAGTVAAGGVEAVAAGVHMLEEGGNAADAAAATIFALNVTDHVQCSIGGEVPLIIFDAHKQEVKVLAGQGRAPLSQDAVDWYMANGIPERDDVKMAPVPSVVDLCITTLQRYGTMTFDKVIEPTIALLDAGDEAWHPKLALTLRRLVEEEGLTRGSRAEKLQAACDRFYGRSDRCNDIAEELEADYIERGGFLRRADLAAHTTPIEDPVTADYRGYRVCKCGPWTQGPFMCQSLRLLEGFDLESMGHNSADSIHLIVEAIKLGMADRDAYYADPEFTEVPLDILLSDAYTEMRRPLIDMASASLEARPGDPYEMKPVVADGVFRPAGPGTTTCVVADRWGNVISATPSANVDTGNAANMDGGRTGVTYGNRLTSLNTSPGHPNCIEPGKRPRITLTPTLVLKDGKPVIAISVAGADRQDQTAIQLLLDLVDFGMTPAEAVTSPRYSTLHHQHSFDPNPDRSKTFKNSGELQIMDTVPQPVLDELTRRGHPLNVSGSPLSVPVMLHIDEDGTAHAAGDPQVGRHAAGL